MLDGETKQGFDVPKRGNVMEALLAEHAEISARFFAEMDSRNEQTEDLLARLLAESAESNVRLNASLGITAESNSRPKRRKPGPRVPAGPKR